MRLLDICLCLAAFWVASVWPQVWTGLLLLICLSVMAFAKAVTSYKPKGKSHGKRVHVRLCRLRA